MAAAVINPFEYTATGILGDKRETMLGNQLLLRGELGKPMSRGYSHYPGETFRYGRPNFIRDGGATEALRGWASANGLLSRKLAGTVATSMEGSRTERDYIASNRAAIQAGLTSASDNYNFRATHDIRKSTQPKEKTLSTPTRRLPPSMVFGISTRPSTPIHDLLEHRYQDKWLQERQSELTKRKTEETKKITPGKVHETRASLLRQHQVKVEPAPYWQLPRFTRSAKPDLETFRSEDAKLRAFKNYESDSIGRRGNMGHGIYGSVKY